MQFKDIHFYNSLKKEMRDIVRRNQIPHNILLDAQDGIPAVSLAIAWAQYMNCDSPKEEDSCGICSSCQKFQALQHPDLMFVYPVVKKGSATVSSENYLPEWRQLFDKYGVYWSNEQWLEMLNLENKQAVIYNEDASILVDRLSYAIVEAKYRCVIIYQLEKMTESGCNKLLKLMEEPPDNTIFITVSNHSERLLETIYSRMQRFELPLLSFQEVKEALVSINPSLEEDNISLKRLVNLSQGLISKALLSQKDTHINERNFLYLEILIKGLNSREFIVFRTLGEQMQKDGREAAICFFDYLEESFRLLYRFLITREMPKYLKTEDRKRIEFFLGVVSIENIRDLYLCTEQAIQDIKGNVSTKIVVFSTLLEYTRILSSAIKRSKIYRKRYK